MFSLNRHLIAGFRNYLHVNIFTSDMKNSCELSPIKGDNLHKMSQPIFWEKIRRMLSICHLQNQPRVVKVKLDYSHKGGGSPAYSLCC